MSSAAPELTPEGVSEAVAVALLRHLEWQTDSFSVVFLLADVGPSMALVDWLRRRLDVQGAPLAQRHPNDRQWTRARQRFMGRVNERRFLFESQFPRPLVLALPLSFKDAARRLAPDLWHVRAFSQVLAAPVVRQGWTDAAQATAVGSLPVAAAGQGSDAFDEWQRMFANIEHGRLFLPSARPAVTQLLALGRAADAREVAAQAVAEARRRAAISEELRPPSVLRELSTTLDLLGQVAQAKGDWAQASAAYRESLDISRQRVERLGGTPEALDDLAVTLVHNAELPNTDSKGFLTEATGIVERLASAHPGIERYRDAVAALAAMAAASSSDNSRPTSANDPS